MTNQEKFEKWWSENKGYEITHVGFSTFTEEVMFASWQAAQADQAATIAQLQADNAKFYAVIDDYKASLVPVAHIDVAKRKVILDDTVTFKTPTIAVMDDVQLYALPKEKK
jgi:hypothetical protein